MFGKKLASKLRIGRILTISDHDLIAKTQVDVDYIATTIDWL